MIESLARLQTEGPATGSSRRRRFPVLVRNRGLATASAIVTLGGTIHQVVFHPVVGLANNGDFDRLLGSIGLRSTGPGFSLPYANLHYVTGHTVSQGHYLTSFMPLAWVYGLLTRDVFGGSLDIRALGVLYCVLLSVLVFFLIDSIKGRSTRLTVAAIAVVGLADSRLVAYFNSWYDEPWSLLLLLSLVIVVMRRGSRRLDRLGPVPLVVLSVLLVTTKTQDALLALPLGALILVWFWRGAKGSSRKRALAAGGALCVVAAGGIYPMLQASVYSQQSLYNLVFADLLVHNSHQGATLKQLELPVNMSRYVGSNAFMPNEGFRNPAFQHFATHGGRASVLEYFLSHPGAAGGALSRGVQQGLRPHLTYLGYRTSGSGVKKWSDACEPCAYSTVTQAVSGAASWVIAALYGGSAAVVVLLFRRGRSQLADPILLVLLVSTFSLLSAVFGEGTYEEAKHLYVFYVGTLLDLALVAGSLTSLLGGRGRSDQIVESV